MLKQIKFDFSGEKLWLKVEMNGIYFITYTYQLWSAIASGPPILTNPIICGSNENPNDDQYAVLNDFNPADPVAAYENRVVDIRFWIKKGVDDGGYSVKGTLYQGADLVSAKELGSDSVTGTCGTLSIKQEFLTLKLVK